MSRSKIYLAKMKKNKLANVKAVKGIWQARNDLPDFKQLRNNFDRDKNILIHTISWILLINDSGMNQ